MLLISVLFLVLGLGLKAPEAPDLAPVLKSFSKNIEKNIYVFFLLIRGRIQNKGRIRRFGRFENKYYSSYIEYNFKNIIMKVDKRLFKS